MKEKIKKWALVLVGLAIIFLGVCLLVGQYSNPQTVTTNEKVNIPWPVNFNGGNFHVERIYSVSGDIRHVIAFSPGQEYPELIVSPLGRSPGGGFKPGYDTSKITYYQSGNIQITWTKNDINVPFGIFAMAFGAAIIAASWIFIKTR